MEVQFIQYDGRQFECRGLLDTTSWISFLKNGPSLKQQETCALLFIHPTASISICQRPNRQKAAEKGKRKGRRKKREGKSKNLWSFSFFKIWWFLRGDEDEDNDDDDQKCQTKRWMNQFFPRMNQRKKKHGKGKVTRQSAMVNLIHVSHKHLKKSETIFPPIYWN